MFGAPPRSTLLPKLSASALVAALLVGGAALAPTPAAAATPAHGLVVTEIVPDNSGVDDFEFFEVHNRTEAPINLTEAGVSFAYIYENSDSRTRDVPLSLPADTIIGAGNTVVIWLSYTSTTVNSFAKTEADFMAHYAATQPAADYTIVRATGQAGFANGGERGVRIVDAAGEISRSYYPTGSVAAGRSVHFRVPTSGTATEVYATLGDPTPGRVAVEALGLPTPPVDPGATDPGTTDPGTTDPGTTDPGTTDPGTTDPGTTDPGAQPRPLLARELLITEFAPDNVGTDRYEYVEVANTTDRAIDLSAANVTLVYDFLTGTKLLAYPEGATVPARGTAILWLNYSNTVGLTADNFRSYYGVASDVTVIPISGQDGFANTSERGLRIESEGNVVTAARYLPAQIGAGLGVDYRLPTRTSATTMSVLRPLAPPTPGSVDSDAFVPAPFAPQPDPALVTAPLQITELAPDTANVPGVSSDAYEFIEVYNATSAPIDFSDYTLESSTRSPTCQTPRPLCGPRQTGTR